ncbi:ATP-binding protein [Legionella longbeachae]|nr:ATP-binding protein [Legionella longbeachae]
MNNNAKYTHEKGVIAVNISPENIRTIISVKYNGIGISIEMLPKVFEVFAQEKRFGDPQ